MRRWMLGLSLSCVCAAFLVVNALGQQAQKAQVQLQVKRVPPPNFVVGNQRLSLPDVVVVGRVMGMEPVDVEASPAPNQGKVNYRVAVVQVNEALHGVKKESKMVRVAFIVPNGNDPNVGGGVQIQPGIIQIQPFPPNGMPALPGRRIGFPGVVNVSLDVGQDGLFMLAKHHTENFYVVSNYNGFVPSQNNANYESEVTTVKQLCKVLGNVNASLKADDAQERFLAAAVLITQYRNNTGMPMKQEPISAEESKQILKGLASGDWTPGRYNARVPGPMELFNQLGINAADGYQPTQPINQAMQKWLDENTDKYIIKKLVADPNAQVQPGVNPPQPGVIPPGVMPVQPIQPGLPGRPIRPRPIKLPPQPGAQPLPAPIPPAPVQDVPLQLEPTPPAPQPEVLPQPRR